MNSKVDQIRVVDNVSSAMIMDHSVLDSSNADDGDDCVESFASPIELAWAAVVLCTKIGLYHLPCA